MTATDVFLSYNHPDEPRARQFAGALEEEGFSVWWDATLRSGETFDEVIERALLDAKAVIVLWSPNSVTSRWVRAEATEADRMGKLVPAMIAPCKRPIVFEMTQTADLSRWQGDRNDKAWRDFIADVRHVAEGKMPAVRASATHAPAQVAMSSRISLGRKAAIFVALLAVLGLVTWLLLESRAGGSKVTTQPIQVASFTARGGPEAELLAEALKNQTQEFLSASGLRPKPVDQPEGHNGLALKGSIIAADGRLKAFVQIEHMPTGETVWSDQFEDVIARADSVAVAASVAAVESISALRDAEMQDGVELTPAQIGRIIEGGNLMTVARPDTPGKAFAIFEQFVAEAPKIAHGHAMLALSINALSGTPEEQARSLQRKKAEIAEAIRLSPLAAGAAFDTRFGLSKREFPGQLAKQEDILLDGLRQANQFPFLHMRECEFLQGVGRLGDARPYCERAMALRPTAAPIAWRFAWMDALAGRQQAAEQKIERAAGYYPDAGNVLLVKVIILMMSDRPERALPILPLLQRANPEFSDREIAAARAFIRARQSGSKADRDMAAKALLAIDVTGTRALETGNMLIGSIAPEPALEALQELRLPLPSTLFGLTYLYHPELAEVRADARFWKAADRLGMVAYWKERNVWPDFCGEEMPLARCKALAAAAEKS